MLKYKIGKLTALITLLFIGLGVAALINQNTPEMDPLTSEHRINSKYPDQERNFSVRLPESYEERIEHRFPVLYILDGNENLELADAAVSKLVEMKQMPEVIIVGMHAGWTRGNDYKAEIDKPQSDIGAKQFLKHIEIELLPYINNRYRTSSFRVISGHSWGALFTTFALTEKPGLFNAYLAQSPNLRREWPPYFITRIKKYFKHSPDLNTTYVMTLGDETKTVPGFNQLVEVFKDEAPEAFRWQATRQDGASHMETREPGMYEGLAYIFGPN